MKYKAGEKVVIKENLDNCMNVNPKMKKYCGKTMTIREVNGNSYRMREDLGEHVGKGWYWSEEMIDGLAKKELKIEVGDVVKLKSGKLNGEFAGLSEATLRRRLGDLPYVVNIVSPTNRVLIDGIYVNINNVELIARGIVKEDPKTPEKPAKYKWTEAEIKRADAIAKEILIDLYDKNISPVFYIGGTEINIRTDFGYPSKTKTVTAKCFKGDEPNEKIGKCVALCKLVGKKIPDFILNHDAPKTVKEELIEKLKSQGYNWIARDEDGQLCVFDEKPSVLYNFWGRYGKNKTLSSNFFNDVTWQGGPVKL